MFVFDRITNVLNAAIGRKATCEGNCSCHSVGSELGDTPSKGPETVGGSIDLTGMDPRIVDMLLELSGPDKQSELLAELDAFEDDEDSKDSKDSTCTTEQSGCVHLDYIPVCHCMDGDMKPEWCSASKCPVRMFQVALAEMQKKAAMIAYG